MNQDIRDFVPASCSLLALGEPTHQVPAFARIRNDLFATLAERGFRSIALETDRVAALAVDDFVQTGAGDRTAFSHGFGDLDGNQELVAWMREHNDGLPADERLTFHGFDAPTETMTAPSPRTYLEHARDYLGADVDLAGDDALWERTEAILDHRASIGASAEAARLRSVADDLLIALHARAPQLIATTSRDAWRRARTHLTAGIGLLQYHKQAAEPLPEQSDRIARLSGVRDVLMAGNLLDIRAAEAGRGPTLVFAHNLHLQRNPSGWSNAGQDVVFAGAGAILSSMQDDGYVFIAGSLGRGDTIGLPDPHPGTYEGRLQRRTTGWGLTPAPEVEPGDTRTDTRPEQGYFPLDRATVEGADAVLHIAAG
ncbi:erythromycin esterase family protein [Actinoplanes sp. NPDC051494]|uniref:erythromycin esterase family protein n=1 Tax=Actinoplanes sp. NPDC051494 TaxID=3363907 RepID=UPI00378A4F3E